MAKCFAFVMDRKSPIGGQLFSYNEFHDTYKEARQAARKARANGYHTSTIQHIEDTQDPEPIWDGIEVR